MKRLFFPVFLSSMLIMTGCPGRHRFYDWGMANNSNYDIFVFYDLYLAKHPYPDTLFSFDHTYINIVNAYSSKRDMDHYPLDVIISRMPSDTLSFFFFHADTVKKYSLEMLQRDYKILVRYDLSSEDIRRLKNNYGIPEIPYPPDERMKNMKMYPPYGSK